MCQAAPMMARAHCGRRLRPLRRRCGCHRAFTAMGLGPWHFCLRVGVGERVSLSALVSHLLYTDKRPNGGVMAYGRCSPIWPCKVAQQADIRCVAGRTVILDRASRCACVVLVAIVSRAGVPGMRNLYENFFRATPARPGRARGLPGWTRR